MTRQPRALLSAMLRFGIFSAGVVTPGYNIVEQAAIVTIRATGPIRINPVLAWDVDDGAIVKTGRRDAFPPAVMGI